jgi:hypothetical protein
MYLFCPIKSPRFFDLKSRELALALPSLPDPLLSPTHLPHPLRPLHHSDPAQQPLSPKRRCLAAETNTPSHAQTHTPASCGDLSAPEVIWAGPPPPHELGREHVVSRSGSSSSSGSSNSSSCGNGGWPVGGVGNEQARELARMYSFCVSGSC